MKYSAGILYYRFAGSEVEVFLAHSTGHQNIYSFPKGELDDDETLFECACREFFEETDHFPKSHKISDYIVLGGIRQNKGKKVFAFAIEADIDENDCDSNWCEFPLESGRWIPEIDDYHWFTISEALLVINPKQVSLLIRLMGQINKKRENDSLACISK